MDLTKSACLAIAVFAFVPELNAEKLAPHVFAPKFEKPIFHDIPSRHSALSIEDLLKKCPNVNRSGATDRCLGILSEYFMSDPIWTASRIEYHSTYGTSYGDTFLNNRARKLRYEYDDYAITDVPLWSDILDGKIKERVNLIEQAMERFECNSLLDRGNGIQPKMAERCEAREMVKYAAFLDACITGSHRFFKMSFEAFEDDRTQNVYEYGLESIEKRLLDPDTSRIVKDKFITANLRAAWVSNLCKTPDNLPMRAIGEEALKYRTPLDQRGRPPLDQQGVPVFLRKTHDNLLKLAARAGDEWALISYYPGRESAEYLNNLYELTPILVHRHLGAALGSSLTHEEKLHHQVKAYVMLTEEYPDNEKLSWDYLTSSSVVLASWEYVKADKPLKFPWR